MFYKNLKLLAMLRESWKEWLGGDGVIRGSVI